MALGNLDPDGEIKDFYSVASWLSWRCSIHIRTATEYVKVAHALKQLPGITDEFSRARLSYFQVKMLARVATPGTEKVLVDIAQSSTVGQLARVVGTHRSFLQSEADARSRAQARSVATWFDEDGFSVIRGRLCPDEGAVVEAALRRAIDSMPAPARPQATAEDPPGDVFDHYGARQADALAQVARQFLAVEAKDHPAASLPEVVVHFDFETLTGPHPAKADCHLEGGAALAPSTALRLACDAALVPLIEDGRGNPLSIGRRTRSIPVGLRRALNARDKRCRFPGCPRTRHLNGHHIHHWVKGGPTCITNLVHLCRFHHWLVHEGGYQVVPEGNDLQFRRPDGSPVPLNPTARAGPPKPARLPYAPTMVQPYGLCSGWDGDRMNLGYVMGAVTDAYHQEQANKAQPP